MYKKNRYNNPLDGFPNISIGGYFSIVSRRKISGKPYEQLILSNKINSFPVRGTISKYR
jgi:hypothetical protein